MFKLIESIKIYEFFVEWDRNFYIPNSTNCARRSTACPTNGNHQNKILKLIQMKKPILLVLSALLLFSLAFTTPISVNANSSISSVAEGDQISWEVTDYNETNNLFDPADWWRTSDWAFCGQYNLSIGDFISFLIIDPAACTGTLEIGNLILSFTTRHDIGFNLIIVTGPAGFYIYSFDPAFISDTNWNEQTELANNASSEQGASLTVQTSSGVFLGENRQTISFNWNKSGTISNSTYDYQTGILLHLYAKNGNWILEMQISGITYQAIPGFSGILVTFTLIGLIVLIQLFKKPKMVEI